LIGKTLSEKSQHLRGFIFADFVHHHDKLAKSCFLLCAFVSLYFITPPWVLAF